MTERSYEDAVQVLRARLGGRWEGVESEGRDEMARILKDELGYDDREANDVIDAMIQSGALRYQRARGEDAPAVPPVPVGTGGTTTGASGLAGVPVVPAAAAAGLGGYWHIGPSEITDTPGRKGQIDPTA